MRKENGGASGKPPIITDVVTPSRLENAAEDEREITFFRFSVLIFCFLLAFGLGAPPVEDADDDERDLEADENGVEGEGEGLVHADVVVPIERLEDGQAEVEPRLEVRRVDVPELGLDEPEDVVVGLLTG